METASCRRPPEHHGDRAPDGDEILLEQAVKGDLDAIRTLYERHSGWLVKLATARTGSRGEAQDIVHDTFVGLIGAPYISQNRTRAFLATVLRNRIQDLERRKAFYRRVVMPHVAAHLEEQQRESSILRTLATRRILDQIDATLSTVRPEWAAVFVRHHVLGLRLTEIASELERPFSTVATWYLKTMTRIRSDLKTRGLYSGGPLMADAEAL